MAKKEKEEKEIEDTLDNVETTAKKNEDQIENEVEETTEPQEEDWKKKFEEVNDKYLRLYSDFDNFRKRTIKEKGDLVSSASSGVIKDLLPVLDDFERAIQSNEKSEDLDGLKEGFHLIFSKMQNILHDIGLKPMETKGEKFDMDLHEAITNIPAPTEDDKGKVVDVVEKGYYLNEKVLRYAKVVVGQ